MTLLELTLAARGQRLAIFSAATAAGVANALALLLVNEGARTGIGPGVWTFLLFALAVCVFLVAARWTSHRINAVIEGMLHQIKGRIVGKIERAPLRRLEDIGTEEIFDRLTENMSVISAAASAVGGVLQAGSIFVFALCYVAWLSPATFAVLLPLQLAALALYTSRVRVADRLLREYNARRVHFYELLMGLLRGAKEIKLNRARGREVCEDFARASAGLRDVSTRFTYLFDDSMLFLTCNLYVVLAAVVFVLPEYVTLDEGMLPVLLAIVLFVWGNMEVGLGAYPIYVQANQAMAAIDALERKLDGIGARVEPEQELDPWGGEPGPIELAGASYEYVSASGEAPFRVGPIDLRCEPGEITFIVGGNGSGKSTLLRVLTGLYTPTRGALRCGAVTVEPENVGAYRELCSVIFSDFHLFSRTYGMLDLDPARVEPLLRQMQLSGKTAFRQGRFTRRDLSTGQRKRLAMILTLLEDRPVLVLDEWPADQDPEFRKYFYEELIPTWKHQGKTVIAVSHDDRYFHCADRVVRMESGRIRSVEPGGG